MLIATVLTRTGDLAVNAEKVTWEMALTVSILTNAKIQMHVMTTPIVPTFHLVSNVHVKQVSKSLFRKLNLLLRLLWKWNFLL